MVLGFQGVRALGYSWSCQQHRAVAARVESRNAVSLTARSKPNHSDYWRSKYCGVIPAIVVGVRGVETDMSKGRDSQHREGKKKPDKTLKEKRADKAAKKSGALPSSSINKTLGGKPTSR